VVAADRGVAFADAPVLGTRQPAQPAERRGIDLRLLRAIRARLPEGAPRATAGKT